MKKEIKKNEDYFIWLPKKEDIDFFPIKEGYYSKEEFVKLMRKYKNKPEVIQFIADMLE